MTETASGEFTTTCRDEQVSETVITAVATAIDADPLEMDPLYDSIDPDALDRLCGPSTASPTLQLQFSLAGCEVEVRGDGTVTVTPPEATRERSGESDARPTAPVPAQD